MLFFLLIRVDLTAHVSRSTVQRVIASDVAMRMWWQGWVETTFLDEDLRIGRGDKGSIFVTARQKTPGRQSEKATESIVSAA